MIDFAREADIPSLKQIWQACFDDPEAYIDSHYRHGRRCMRTLVHREKDGTVSSMLEMVDVSLRFRAQSYPAFYIYAASTLPAYRGRRLMHLLIEHACEIGRKEKMAASVLIPGTSSLVSFYGEQGYTGRITIGEKTIERTNSAAEVEELGGWKFRRMKEDYERELPACVEHSRALIDLIYRQTEVSDGKILKIQQNARQAYAVCYKIEEKGFIQEISSEDADLEGDVSAVCSYLGVSSAVVRRPGNTRLYGLARSLTDSSLPWGELYMNTMLD